LRELADSVLAVDAHLFSPRVRARRMEGALGNYHLYGDRHLFTRNDANGVTVTYYLRAAGAAPTPVTVADSTGRTVRTLEGPSTAGINRVVWDLADAERRPLPPGTYAVTLEAGGRRLTRLAVVR
jgi:hypothetical protein